MPGRISRNRGYSFEHKLALEVDALPGWNCRRLGGSSAMMPDLLCVSSDLSIIITTECKSLMSKKTGMVSLYVPKDQIQRCITMVDIFRLYKYREVVLSFKFGRGYKNSYFFTVRQQLWNEILDKDSVVITSCNNYGRCVMKIKSKKSPHLTINLKRRKTLIHG